MSRLLQFGSLLSLFYYRKGRLSGVAGSVTLILQNSASPPVYKASTNKTHEIKIKRE